MKSHFQSSETTWTSSGAACEGRGCAGSRSWELIQAIPPRKMTTSAGIDQTTISTRPEYTKSGCRRARWLEARYHQATAMVAMIVGTTIASMITTESRRIKRSAALMGPAGWSCERPQPASSPSIASAMTMRPTRPAAPELLFRSMAASPPAKARINADLTSKFLCNELEPERGVVAVREHRWYRYQHHAKNTDPRGRSVVIRVGRDGGRRRRADGHERQSLSCVQAGRSRRLSVSAHAPHARGALRPAGAVAGAEAVGRARGRSAAGAGLGGSLSLSCGQCGADGPPARRAHG